MPRFATIDVGTNSVLLLVAERDDAGRFVAIEEAAEITRLGRGVDRTRRLAPEGIAATLEVVERFARTARGLGAAGIAVSATSAARDAENGADFVSEFERRTGLTLEIISGDEEARLSFRSAFTDFGGQAPLAVVDIGGGSTEVILGDREGRITFRQSFDVGSVRLTERHVKSDPPAPGEREAVAAEANREIAGLPRPPPETRLIGIAGTVTTVVSVARRIEPYDPLAVHGARLTREDIGRVVEELASVPLEQRRRLPGLEPKRADVIVAGAILLGCVLDALGMNEVTASDRGLRWGLLADRFGAPA
jgi:exopolyphosphatase / guanosine-5'-triphosphate,3'-diphosphate pyrophosphatase